MQGNNPKYIIVHCTDTSQKFFDQFKSVNNYHRDVRGFPVSSLGYYVGYHALITGGKLYRPRQDYDEGAHCNQQKDGLSMNFQSLGICLGFDGDIEMPEAYMLPLLKEQIEKWKWKYGIDDSRIYFHRDFAKDKTCPGSLITRDWLLKVIYGDKYENPVVPPPSKDEDQVEKQKSIQDQITLIAQLVDQLKRLLFERFGIRV